MVVAMVSEIQRRRFVGQVFAVARRRRTDFETLASFRTALIVDAGKLGRGRISQAMRLQVARSVAAQVWGEPVDELETLDPQQSSFLRSLG